MGLWNWLAWPLGIRGVDIAGVRSVSLSVNAGSAASAALVAVGVLGVAFSIVSYVSTTEPVARRRRIAFAVARASVYVLLVLALCGLAFEADFETVKERQCLVVVDNTLSMAIETPESAAGKERLTGKDRGAWKRLDSARELLTGRSLSGLRQRRSVSLALLDGSRIGPLDLPGLEASQDRTDIPSALERMVCEARAADLSEIVLVTDGKNTARRSYRVLSAALQERKVRLYPVIVGKAPDFRDVRLTAATTTPYCRAFDQLVVSFTVHDQGCAGLRTKVEVVEADEPAKTLASTELALDSSPTGQHGRLVLPPPRQKGDVHLVVRVSDVPGEIVRENNQMDIFTLIVGEPVKVLYIDNFPRSEFKHIKQSLDRDPNVALTLLTRMPGGAWFAQGPCLLEKPELGFPAEIAELMKYDVLILGSISRGYFSANDRFEEAKLTNIARFVSGRGGGLIVLGGHRSFGHGKYGGSPLEPLFPFEIAKPGEEKFLTEEIRAELATLARFHPALQLSPATDENLKTWAELPELMGCNLVGKPRPGAEVLAVASKEVEGEKPILLACQQYGFGRVFACTTYSTCRWRLGMPRDKGDLLSRFWSQVLRYVSPDPRVVASAINLQVDKPHYVRGETARLSLQPLDAYYSPLQREEIRLDVRMPDETTTLVELREDPSTKGIYPAEVELTQPGAYEVTATSRKGLSAHLTLVAGASSEEFDDPAPETEPLEAVARESGGALFSVDEAEKLVDGLGTERATALQKVESPLWDSPLFLFLVLGLCLSEWFFRKRSGLA